jgi:hypothetical protein
MDIRLLLVLAPFALVAFWVYKNIGKEAIDQGKEFISRE